MSAVEVCSTHFDSPADQVMLMEPSIATCPNAFMLLMTKNNCRSLPKEKLARPSLPDVPVRLRLRMHSSRQQPRVLYRCGL